MRLATFNLMHGRSLADGLVDVDRVGAAVGALDADVVGLQEVDRAQPRSGLADLAMIAAAALDAPYVTFVPAVVGTPGESFRPATEGDLEGTDAHYGVALVSRYPVLDRRITRLPPAPVRSPIFVPGPRGRAGIGFFDDEPRVLIAAVVRSPIGVLTVATTHLSFVPGWNVRQLRMVRRALRKLPAPRILLADLNLPGPLPRLASGWRQLARRPTYPSPAPRVQFDHILADPVGVDLLPPVDAVATPASPISDHRPLIVTLHSA